MKNVFHRILFQKISDLIDLEDWKTLRNIQSSIKYDSWISIVVYKKLSYLWFVAGCFITYHARKANNDDV